MTQSAIRTALLAHHKDAYLWALQCCFYHTENAKDVQQMAYLKVLEKKAVFNNKSAFKTWLFAIIRFTAIDFYKSKPKFTTINQVDIAAQTYQPEQEIDFKKYLNKLPKRQQEVLVLAFYHNMSLSAIAKVMDVHVGTVRTHYTRGKDALREQLQTIAL